MTNAWGDPLDEHTIDDSPMVRVGRSAINRLALRAVRRDLRRSILIVLLLAVPVAVAIVVAAGQRAVWPGEDELRSVQVGQADVEVQLSFPIKDQDDAALDEDDLVRSWGMTPVEAESVAALLERARDAGSERIGAALGEAFGDGRVLPIRTDYATLAGRGLQIDSFDMADPVAEGLVSLERGRAPAAGEIVISPALADLLDAEIGDTIELEPVGAREVSGIARLRRDHGGLTAIVAGETSGDPAAPVGDDGSIRFLVDAPDDLDLGFTSVTAIAEHGLAEAFGVESVEPMSRTGLMYASSTADSWQSDELEGIVQPPVLSGFVAALLLCLVALVAAAGFATGARRRIREFGLLATVGASPAHIRRLVLVEAALLGAVGAVVGVAAGVVAAPAATGLAQGLAWQTIDDVHASLLDALGPVLAAVGGAVLAAWFPARTVARAPVLGALAGRVPQRPLSPRAVPSGVALLGVGLLVVGAGAAGIREQAIGETTASFVMVFGCLLCLGGAALVATFVAGRIGAHADRLPLGFRLVARDAARQQFRTAVSVAGLVIVLAAPVMVVAGVRSIDALNGGRSAGAAALPDEVVIDLRGEAAVTSGEVVAGADIETRIADTVAAIDDIVPVETSGTLIGFTEAPDPDTTAAAGVPEPDGPSALVTASGETERNGYQGWSVYGTVAHGTPDAVATLRLPASAAAALADGDAVAVGSDPGSLDLLSSSDGTPIDTIEVVPTDRQSTWSAPVVLIPPRMADRLGLVATEQPYQLVIDLERSLTDEDRNRIWTALARPELELQDAAISLGDGFTPAATTAQAIAIPVGLVLVLVVGGCLVAVAATESDRDIATMVRVGAAPSLRRRFLAMQGWYHATLAAVLGAPIGILLVVALRQAIRTPTPVLVPWLTLVVVVVAAPAALGAVVAASVRSVTPSG